MGEYLFSVVLTSALLGVLSYASYPSVHSERSMKVASSVLLLYVVINPVFSLVENLSYDGIEDFFGSVTGDFNMDESQMAEASEQAFANGIATLLQQEFGADKDFVKVSVFGFDFKNMKAEKIKITLSGKSAFLDWRRIEDYITRMGLGDCEVNVRLE